MDELLKKWRDAYDSKMEDTAEVRKQIDALSVIWDEISAPYHERMKELEKDIKAQALVMGEGRKGDGVAVNYRKGYERVSYAWERVDTVRDVLRDVLPDTAKTLDSARKSSFVSPSVSVKAVEG